MAQSLPDRKVKTIPKSLIFSKWLVSSVIVLDQEIPSPLPSSSSSDTEDTLDSDEEARTKVQSHGAAKAIIDRNMTDTGLVTYTVEWKDGIRSEESPRVMRKVDSGLVEEYEHQYLVPVGEVRDSSDGDYVDDGEDSRSDMDTDSEPSSKEHTSSSSGTESSGAEKLYHIKKNHSRDMQQRMKDSSPETLDGEYERDELEASDEEFIISKRMRTRRKQRESTTSSSEAVPRRTRSTRKKTLESEDDYVAKPRRQTRSANRKVSVSDSDNDEEFSERPRKQIKMRAVLSSDEEDHVERVQRIKSSAGKKRLEAFRNTSFRRSDGVFEDIDEYSSNFMNAHWINCFRCGLPGYPNGPPAKLPTDSRPISDDPLVMSKAEERELQGRLLLCLTCTAAAHESCNAANKKVANMRIKKQRINDETKTQYQCTLCFREVEERLQKDPTALPHCVVCDKPDHRTKVTVTIGDKQAGEIPEANAEPVVIYQQEDENCLLFRCRRCARTFHRDCLPDFPDVDDALLENVPKEFRKDKSVCDEEWHCPECIVYGDAEKIMTWRSSKEPEDRSRIFDDETTKPRELLIKWKNKSYQYLTWVSEAWCAAACQNLYRHFCNKAGMTRSQSFEDVAPESWMTADRILEAQDKRGKTIKIDRIDDVHRIFVKHLSRSYDDACWDVPPAKDSKFYPAYARAFSRYIKGWQLKPPSKMAAKIEEVREVATAESYERHELKKQPDFVTGGELFPHQLDGLNWLIYQWERDSPCILADDMGLGKTVQVITFLYYLVHRFSIYPFLLVVPNSTSSNWLREFETWAPDMVVVPYYGSATSLRYARDYELFRGEGNYDKIKCHAVILTYESALKDKGLFQRVTYWPALIVDEGQRLKNDTSSLFKKLQSLRFSHKILMTGTPLQNNVRELMNIMHFIDPGKFDDAEELEKKYNELDRNLVQELHNELRPYFLRRTKESVLRGKLPPKAEIIVPVTMTPLQKEVCKDILDKNLISYAALIDKGKKNSANSKRSLNNTLMQLRKALNHPYLIDGVEIQQPDLATTQKLLIEASSKLQVLHQMLPKLKKDGHRVLIFSTMKLTLDVLEDYLTTEGYKYERIDGNTPSVHRADSIDRFNAKDSDVFVFLLTTRAGGVGINLATADTVIMWDFDYNPHSDLQAASRAYRIGQKNPVLIFKFMTRYTVEEKIAQIAKKKMVLDHLIVETMEEESIEDLDVESILKFGAQALFEEDNSKKITYDSMAIDKLLDRSQATTKEVEEVNKETEQSKQSFAFAKVWSVDKKEEEELPIEESAEQDQKQEDFWLNYLKQKAEKAKELQQQQEELGRGQRRKRAPVNYFAFGAEPPTKKSKKKGKDKTEGEENEKSAPGSPASQQSDKSYVQVESDGGETTESEEFTQRRSSASPAQISLGANVRPSPPPPQPMYPNPLISTERFQQPALQAQSMANFFPARPPMLQQQKAQRKGTAHESCRPPSMPTNPHERVLLDLLLQHRQQQLQELGYNRPNQMPVPLQPATTQSYRPPAPAATGSEHSRYSERLSYPLTQPEGAPLHLFQQGYPHLVQRPPGIRTHLRTDNIHQMSPPFPFVPELHRYMMHPNFMQHREQPPGTAATHTSIMQQQRSPNFGSTQRPPPQTSVFQQRPSSSAPPNTHTDSNPGVRFVWALPSQRPPTATSMPQTSMAQFRPPPAAINQLQQQQQQQQPALFVSTNPTGAATQMTQNQQLSPITSSNSAGRSAAPAVNRQSSPGPPVVPSVGVVNRPVPVNNSEPGTESLVSQEPSSGKQSETSSAQQTPHPNTTATT